MTDIGLKELDRINKFSNEKIVRAFHFIPNEDQDKIIASILQYANALEQSRVNRQTIKIHTLPTSRTIRSQIVEMITHIQRDEFMLPVTTLLNQGIIHRDVN